jgi:hypothetical protein
MYMYMHFFSVGCSGLCGRAQDFIGEKIIQFSGIKGAERDPTQAQSFP